MENKNYKDIRTSYEKSSLRAEDLDQNPLNAFENWFNIAIKSNVAEPNAMVLSTVNSKGTPSSRVVLIKEISKEGIVFYTNYNSKKGLEIKANPNVSILFFWQELQRQVRIEGKVIKNSQEDSDEYFYSRPIESQLGAMASEQSSVLQNRDELEFKFDQLDKEHPKRPANWGGYIVIPEYFEFWQGRANRLHDRISYSKRNNIWEIDRLSP